MLSRLLTSAKSIFNQPQSIENISQNEKLSSISEEMVTTRRNGKSASDAVTTDDSIDVQTPRSSRKRQRKTEVESLLEGTNSSSKEEKDLPMRVKEDEIPRSSTRVVVEIPISKSPLGAKGDNIAGKSTKIREIIEIEDSEESDDDQDEMEEEDSAPQSQENTSKSEKPSIKVIDEIQIGKDDSTASSAPKPKHKRFGSEEPEVEFYSTAIEKVESEDESSDDDDAPEVVETHVAQKVVESRARDAARAIEEQESAIRQKRKDRDAALKQQAEAANKKRKRGNEDELAADSKKSKVSSDVNPTRFTTRGPLPDLLPAEYLEDNEEGSDVDLISDSRIPIEKPKKTKFTDVLEKKPKDRRKGSTIYRVSEVRSANLAPKASAAARSWKNQLYRRPGKKLESTRKSFSVGFSKSR